MHMHMHIRLPVCMRHPHCYLMALEHLGKWAYGQSGLGTLAHLADNEVSASVSGFGCEPVGRRCQRYQYLHVLPICMFYLPGTIWNFFPLSFCGCNRPSHLQQMARPAIHQAQERPARTHWQAL